MYIHKAHETIRFAFTTLHCLISKNIHKTAEIEGTTVTNEEYEEAIVQLKSEHSKKKGRNHSLVKSLMEKTRSTRWQWILDDTP